MAILNNNPLIGSGGQQGYNINNSLRFRSSASAYLNRTPASAGNRRTWTWSGWVKRGNLGSINMLFSCFFANNDNSQLQLAFNSNNALYVAGYSTDFLITTAVYRDPSAWYHIVCAVDTTSATANNRIRLYVNGSEITTFGTRNNPSQNTDLAINTAQNHFIGYGNFANSYLDGYQTEVNFVDGQQLTPSSFGETDTTTGVWKPKAYSGTYGTNGFYLKFSDIATTSGSNAGLGKDFSGNSNYWTTNNISVTSGVTYDAMTDSPTNTSATVANYCVLNPLNKDASASVTEANLKAVGSGATNRNVFCTMAVPSTEKIYFEVDVVTGTSTGNYFTVGIAPSTLGLNTEIGTVSGSFGINSDQAASSLKRISGTATSYGAGTSYATGNVLQVAIDQASGKIWFGKNNTWFDSGNPSAGTNPATSTLSTTEQYFPVVTLYQATPVVAFNFGQRPFAYTPPTGFVALNTFNLPTPTILQGNKYMDATTYTGDGASPRSITNTASFKPDLVWVKSRSNAEWNILFDSVRGTGKSIYSNDTAAEVTNAANGYVSAFNSNGYSVTAGSSGSGNVNASAYTYVGWQWQAGQGSTSSGTGTGGITSVTQSVNATAGFSVVTFTASGANGTFTHGLGVAPKMFIIKARNVVASWGVWHDSLTTPSTALLLLDSTGAQTNNATYWNSTVPTSSTVSIGTAWSAGNYVAYCWAEIAGFSKFGSYTGNGSADGPFVFTGFRPKFILYKNSSFASTGWAMLDSSRNTYNVINARLFSESSGAEDTSVSPMDFTSNGFKVRSTNDGVNRNGDTIIYMAFAENPFKNSLAR